MTSVYVTVTTEAPRDTIRLSTTRTQEDPMAIRTATAEWKGDLPSGEGTFHSASGALDGGYSFKTRFEEEPGTNPEELIAAAHSSCFSMALSGVLSQGGNPPESIQTEARVQLLKQGEGFGITRIELATVGRVPGIDQAGFEQAAQTAKETCPISRALAAVPEITVDARLEG
jgi:lipoyl-dependent peroxiredoxin